MFLDRVLKHSVLAEVLVIELVPLLELGNTLCLLVLDSVRVSKCGLESVDSLLGVHGNAGLRPPGGQVEVLSCSARVVHLLLGEHAASC